jgi:hypothetical protein
MRCERRMNPKCHSRAVCDTFSARSAELTGLKMRRITRGVSFDHLVGDGHERRRHAGGGSRRSSQLLVTWVQALL